MSWNQNEEAMLINLVLPKPWVGIKKLPSNMAQSSLGTRRLRLRMMQRKSQKKACQAGHIQWVLKTQHEIVVK